jgi:hypothetical protein
VAARAHLLLFGLIGAAAVVAAKCIGGLSALIPNRGEDHALTIDVTTTDGFRRHAGLMPAVRRSYSPFGKVSAMERLF